MIKYNQNVTRSVNSDGISFYNSLIDDMIANNITPIATLYHWDLPQVGSAT